MVVVTNKQYYMDGFLKQNFDEFKPILIEKDWDFVGLIDGREGSGKSTIAQQACYYFDETFNLDRIVFTPQEFEEQVMKAEKGQAILWDEAAEGTSANNYYSQINKSIKRMLQQIRQKNLVIFIVLPYFFELEKYVAIARSQCLIHVYTKPGTLVRGFFTFFGYTNKKNLYVAGKKFYSYDWPKSDFHGNFRDGYVVDEAAYRKKKSTSLAKLKAEPQTSKDIRFSEQRDKVIYEFWKVTQYPYKTIADILELTEDIIEKAMMKHKPQNSLRPLPLMSRNKEQQINENFHQQEAESNEVIE